MTECPECGDGELVTSAANTDSRGTRTVYECDNCNTQFEVDEIETE